MRRETAQKKIRAIIKKCFISCCWNKATTIFCFFVVINFLRYLFFSEKKKSTIRDAQRIRNFSLLCVFFRKSFCIKKTCYPFIFSKEKIRLKKKCKKSIFFAVGTKPSHNIYLLAKKGIRYVFPFFYFTFLSAAKKRIRYAFFFFFIKRQTNRIK